MRGRPASRASQAETAFLMPDYLLKLHNVLPANIADRLVYAFKNYQNACTAESEMHALTKSAAAHRLVYEHKTKCSLDIQRIVGEAMRYLELGQRPTDPA